VLYVGIKHVCFTHVPLGMAGTCLLHEHSLTHLPHVLASRACECFTTHVLATRIHVLATRIHVLASRVHASEAWCQPPTQGGKGY
jgi:hypothetical protein